MCFTIGIGIQFGLFLFFFKQGNAVFSNSHQIAPGHLKISTKLQKIFFIIVEN